MSVASELAAISAAITTANAVTGVHEGAGDDAIISAIVNFREVTMPTLPLSASQVGDNLVVVAPKSLRVAQYLCPVLHALAERGYYVGDAS